MARVPHVALNANHPAEPDLFCRRISHEGMKPNPLMIAAIFLTFVAALTACHLALISDLLMVTVVLALLIVLVTTEPDSGVCNQSRNRPTRKSLSAANSGNCALGCHY